MKNRKTKHAVTNFVRELPVRIFLLLAALTVIYPLLWSVMMAFKTNKEILTDPWALPEGLALDNFVRAFTKAHMSEYFMNSVGVTILSIVLLILFAVPAAYVLARFDFIGAKLIRNVYMACIFVQGTYLMVPLFLELLDFHMLDNRATLSLMYAVTNFPFTIFLLTGFFKEIPGEYSEAAKVDGASSLQIMLKVMVPMAKAGISTASMLALMGFWNEYSLALILLQSDKKKTLPIGLANLFAVQKYATDWGALYAALTIVLVPTFILYLFGNKKLTSGLSVGGLKG